MFLRQRWRVRTSVLETKGKKELPFKTKIERKFCARDEGEDRDCFLRQRCRVRSTVLETEGKKELPFKTKIERKF